MAVVLCLQRARCMAAQGRTIARGTNRTESTGSATDQPSCQAQCSQCRKRLAIHRRRIGSGAIGMPMLLLQLLPRRCACCAAHAAAAALVALRACVTTTADV